jgi:hypothetical protein
VVVVGPVPGPAVRILACISPSGRPFNCGLMAAKPAG